MLISKLSESKIDPYATNFHKSTRLIDRNIYFSLIGAITIRR